MRFFTALLLMLVSAAAVPAECVQGNCVNGFGHMTYADGSTYAGQWRDGKRHGQGTQRRANGGVVTGRWVDDEEKGHGTYTFVNRAKYAIEWTGDEPQTDGPWAYANGGKYVGGRDDREHGHGTVMYNDGGTYIGGYDHGNKQGKGTFWYPSGGLYFGDWEGGKPGGRGTFVLPDGGVYIGEWHNGMPNGLGILTEPDNSTKEGLWQDGQFVGAQDSSGGVMKKGSVLVFGASRGTGYEATKLLAERGDHVTAFVRPTSDRSGLEPLGVDYAVGDILDPVSVAAAFASGEFRAVINTVGGRRGEPRPDFEGVKNMVEAAKAAGVSRVLLVTAIGTGDSLDTVSARTREVLGPVLAIKSEAEAYLTASGLDYTILRPGGLTREPASGTGIMTEDHGVMGSISRAELGALVVKALDDDSTIGKILHTIDPAITNKPPLER